MYPTADEAAKIIIAAFRVVNANPLSVDQRISRGRQTQHGRAIVQGRGYAVFAFRKLFPNISSRSIARMIGPVERSVVDDLLRKGKPRWFDQIDFERVLRNCGVEGRKPVQIYRDETTPTAVLAYAHPPARPASFGSKKRLEDELRAAVENTARMHRS